MVTRRSSLGPLKELGRGGFGTVYRTRVALDGTPTQLAYKELHEPKKGAKAAFVWNQWAIKESVNFRDGLGEHDRATLDAFTLWPREVVHEDGRITGYLMNEIAPEFHLPAKGEPVLATLGWLAAKDSTLAASGIDPLQLRQFPVRLALVTQLAYCIAWLHRRGRIFGDLSLSNCIFVASPTRLMLMDCDATAHHSDRHRKQADSPFCQAPEGSERQTFESDVYKLALCIVRALSKGRGATQVATTRLLEQPLSFELTNLLKDALNREPGMRPAARELWQALSNHLDLTYPQPKFRAVSMSPERFALRGQDVIVRWECENAKKIVITGPDGTTIEARPETRSAAIRVTTAGEVRIRATNDHGRTDATAGEIHVYEITAPEISKVKVPRVNLRHLPRPELAAPRTQIPTLPLGLPPFLPQIAALRPRSQRDLAGLCVPIQRELAGLNRAVQGMQADTVAVLRHRVGELQVAARTGAEGHRKATEEAVREALSQSHRTASPETPEAPAAQPEPAAPERTDTGDQQ